MRCPVCEVRIVRKLMWFSIGFVCACALGAYVYAGGALLLAAAVGLVAGVLVCLCAGNWPKRLGIMLIGCSLGFCWVFGYNHILMRPLLALDGQTANWTVQVTDYGWQTESGVVTNGKVHLFDRDYTVQVYLPQSTIPEPGDVIQGKFDIQVYTPNSKRPSLYNQSEGIWMMGFGYEDTEIQSNNKIPLYVQPVVWKHRLLMHLQRLFPDNITGLAQGLLLGDTQKLSAQDRENFRTTGISHVLVVSGQHLAILFAMLYVLVGKRRGLIAILGIPALIAFSAVVGFTPSITRACIMQILMILAMLCNREYDPPTALSFSVLMILIGNPFSVASVGFQLSVGCMIGIFVFYRRVQWYFLSKKYFGCGKWKKLKGRLALGVTASLAMSISTTIVVMPLCALYFGQVSLVGILTNLLCIWLITYGFYGVILAAILGGIWLPLGTAAAWVTAWLLRCVLWITRGLAAIPFAAVQTNSVYIVLWLIFVYVLLFLFYKMQKKRLWMLVSALAISLGVAVTASRLEPGLENYRLTVLDVGQGQCILLQSNGKTYMVDCGGDSDETAARMAAFELLSQGVYSLDGLILTHYDKDHTGGVEKLLSRLPVERIYLPVPEETDALAYRLQTSHSEQIRWVNDTLHLSCGAGNITLLPPVEADTSNERSLCILFQAKECDILITGDRSTSGEEALLKQVALPKLEVLVVGHHGSDSSTGLPLLQQTRPAVAILSVGADNNYGHPSPGVLRVLQLFGCRILRTDLEGTIIIRG